MNFKEFSYGVTEHFEAGDEIDEKVLELKINGYTTIQGDFN